MKTRQFAEKPSGRCTKLVFRQGRQTQDQERQFNAAIDALLSELVRQEISRKEQEHE